MARWRAEQRPKTGLQIKYLRKIMTARELENLIDRYVEAKKKAIAACPECDGEGKVEYIVSNAHQAYSEDRGTYIEDERRELCDCERCNGTGKRNQL